MTGTLRVDGAGVAHLRIPLGPGIGDAQLGYLPSLVGRFAAQVGLAPLAQQPGPAPALQATSAFALSPGALDGSFGPGGQPRLRWTFPDGRSGSLGGILPEHLNAEGLLARFGYGPMPGHHHPPLSVHVPLRFCLPGSDGEVVLGLADEFQFPPQPIATLDEHGMLSNRVVPSGLLVIQEPRAYEFSYAEHQPATGLVHYRLTAIRDGGAAPVTFSYGVNGVDYQANYKAARLRVALDGLAPIAPIAALDDALSPLGSSGADRCAAFRGRGGYRDGSTFHGAAFNRSR